MSKYSVNEPELQHARQLLISMEADLSSQRRKIMQTRNLLYGQQGYGVAGIRNELELQADTLRTQTEYIEKLQECMQFIINCTIAANNSAKQEIVSGELKQEAVVFFGGGGGGGRIQAEKSKMEIKSPYDLIKNGNKGISAVKDLMEMLEVGDKGAFLDSILHTPILDHVAKQAKREKLLKAAQKGDVKKVLDTLGKEAGKKIGKKGGVKGFEFEAYYTMGKVWGKNYSAYVKKCMTEDISFGDRAAAFWSLTGGTLLETGAEIAYDKLTSVIPWYDDYYGGSVSGFYEKLGEIKDSIVDAYGIKNVGDAIVKVGKTTVSFYGEKLSKLLNWRK